MGLRRLWPLKRGKGGRLYLYLPAPAGRKAVEKTRNGKVVLTCTYYPGGHLRSLTDHRGKTLYYTYDGEGRQESLKTQEGQVWPAIPIRREAAGHYRERKRDITRYTYDGKETCPVFLSRRERPGLLYAAAFTYDLRGNRLTKRGQRLGEGGRREKTHYHYAWIEEAGAVCPVMTFRKPVLQ